MGLFDRLLKKTTNIPQSQWSLIALAISTDFEDIRRDLYDVCAEALVEFSKRGNFEIAPRSFSDEIQGMNIKVFQLILASLLIGKKKYIPQHQGNDFADLLWAQVLGNQILPAIQHGKTLFQKGDAFPRLFTFFCHVGEGITGKLNPADGMLLLSTFGSAFIESCYGAVVSAFSDGDVDDTLRNEMASVNNQITLISQRFDDEIKRITDDG